MEEDAFEHIEVCANASALLLHLDPKVHLHTQLQAPALQLDHEHKQELVQVGRQRVDALVF